jgi:hypothetical protein
MTCRYKTLQLIWFPDSAVKQKCFISLLPAGTAAPAHTHGRPSTVHRRCGVALRRGKERRHGEEAAVEAARAAFAARGRATADRRGGRRGREVDFVARALFRSRARSRQRRRRGCHEDAAVALAVSRREVSSRFRRRRFKDGAAVVCRFLTDQLPLAQRSAT